MSTHELNHNYVKFYSYPYPSILCTKTKYALTQKQQIEFSEGKYYPFTCISYEVTGAVNPTRPTQVIAEDGYKVLFMGEDIEEFFEVNSVKLFSPRAIL